MVTLVCPADDPWFGCMALTTGVPGGANVKWSALVAALEVPPASTMTSTVPAVPAGLIAKIKVSPATEKVGAVADPNTSAVAPVKPIPNPSTLVPPDGAPLLGETPFTWSPDGGGPPYTNWSLGE